MMQAEALAISIDMAALMAGEVKITGVEAINPRIVLERSAKGAENWVFGGGGAGGVDRLTAELPADRGVALRQCHRRCVGGQGERLAAR